MALNALQFGIEQAIWTAAQPVVGTPSTAYAVPNQAKYMIARMTFPGSAPAAITLNVLGSLDGVTYATIGSFTELVNTVKRIDVEGWPIVAAVIATHTTPQNNTLVFVVTK